MPVPTIAELKEWAATEWQDEARHKANMGLLRAVALFAGSVFIMRNFGDALAI